MNITVIGGQHRWASAYLAACIIYTVSGKKTTSFLGITLTNLNTGS